MDIAPQRCSNGTKCLRFLPTMLEGYPGLTPNPFYQSSDRQPRIDTVFISRKSRYFRIERPVRFEFRLVARHVPQATGTIIGNKRERRVLPPSHGAYRRFRGLLDVICIDPGRSSPGTCQNPTPRQDGRAKIGHACFPPDVERSSGFDNARVLLFPVHGGRSAVTDKTDVVLPNVSAVLARNPQQPASSRDR